MLKTSLLVAPVFIVGCGGSGPSTPAYPVNNFEGNYSDSSGDRLTIDMQGHLNGYLTDYQGNSDQLTADTTDQGKFTGTAEVLQQPLPLSGTLYLSDSKLDVTWVFTVDGSNHAGTVTLIKSGI